MEHFGSSFEHFEDDFMFQDACCMCVIQIGELAGQLSDEIKSQSPSVPWRIIKDTRNFYVHAYGNVDIEAVWITLTEDIPTLKKECGDFGNYNFFFLCSSLSFGTFALAEAGAFAAVKAFLVAVQSRYFKIFFSG